MTATAKVMTLATLQDNNTIHGVANSLTKTRNGVTVTERAVESVVGQTVPLLLSHDWDSLPIGQAKMTALGDDGLEYEGTIFDSAPNRDQILEGIKNGVLAVSIGFGVTEATKKAEILGMDLYELSITPIPADSQATVTQSLKFDNMEDFTKMATEPEAQPTADAPAHDAPKDDAKLSDVVEVLNNILDAVNKLSKPKDDNADEKDPKADPAQPAAGDVKESLNHSELDKIARKVVQLKSTNRKGEIELLNFIKDLGGNK